MLKVSGLSFQYEKTRDILKDVSFEMESGDILCLLGPNGTGKTTLLRCLLSLNKATSGRIQINETDVTKVNAQKRAKLMAYVPQANNVLFPYKSWEIVMMGRVSHLGSGRSPGAKDWSVVNEVMDRLGITPLAHKTFNRMSGGEKQMIMVARALAQDARILIMDEPTASLDYSNQVKILRTIKKLSEEGYSILMTSHFPDHAFLAGSKVALLNDGVIVAKGLPEEVVTTESLSALYQTPVHVTEAFMEEGPEKIKVCIPLMK